MRERARLHFVLTPFDLAHSLGAESWPPLPLVAATSAYVKRRVLHMCVSLEFLAFALSLGSPKYPLDAVCISIYIYV